MRFILIVAVLVSNTLLAQFLPNEESGFIVDTIRLKHALVPKLQSTNDSDSAVTNKVNEWILKTYGMNNWEDQYGGIWGQASLTLKGYKIEKGFLVLDVYMTSRGSDSNRRYFIKLINGNEIRPVNISFPSLFEPDQYLHFIEEFWYEDLKQELTNSYTCCETDIDESWREEQCYQVLGFSFSQEKLILHEYRWGPSGFCWGACATLLKREIELKKVYPHLNGFGKMIVKDAIYEKNNHYFGYSWDEETSIEEVEYIHSLKDRIPTNLFFFGKIADKYPIKMSLNLDKDERITGSYYYTSTPNKPIELRGQRLNGDLIIKEYVNRQITGSFVLEEIKTKYYYKWKGQWTSPDEKQVHDISITASFK